jgi:pimeloyl-ACP methyl ester carboxylesterase
MLNYYHALGRSAKVPTLIPWGQKDRFIRPYLADAAAAYCGDVRLIRFEEATHWIHHEEPRRAAAEIDWFSRGD